MPLRTRLLPLAAALCAAGGVHAQSTPYYVGVSQSFTHESNIYRTRNNEVSDTISTTSLYGGVDQMVGRQRVYGNATVSANKFMDNGSLDNTGYGLKAGVDWATIERISGTVELNANQSLARYENSAGNSDKNTLRDLSFRAVARVGVVTRLTAETGYTYRRVDYSLNAYRARNFDQNAVSAGLRYRFSGALTAGAALRFTKGEYADRNPRDEYDRRDIDFTATWTPTGNSSINGRVSLSDTSHSVASNADFSGVTGDLTWNWRPTGKLQFVTSLTRDTGEEISLLGGSADQVLTNSRISTSIGTRATYEVTSKVMADASVRYVHRKLDASLLNLSADGGDNTRFVSVGLRWAAMRSLTLGCNVGYESRTSSSVLSAPYDTRTASCYGQFALQL
ncbi:hypothetical protein [uncultured Aquincola sp.]|uniref:hypothetical protein n=1 Tax=uncultured Aquincola sp. TaxID=886556 RepID=UPI0032B21642